MEWFSLSARIFIFSSFLTATSVGDYSTGAIQAIRCMLLQTAVLNCSTVPEVPVSVYLVKTYNESPSTLHEALRTGQLADLTDDDIADLPLTLLYLIPRGRLTDLNGTQLAAILQEHSDDTSIARQLTASVLQYKQLTDLVLKLKQSNLPQNTLQIIGESINLEDVNHILDTLILREPLLAYLRPKVMLGLSDKTGFDVLGRLKGIQPPKLETIHIITRMAIKIRFPLININWLVSGLSPDEIKSSTFEIDINPNNFKLDLTIAQTRAMFEHIYQNSVLNKSDSIDCKPILQKLTPLMLQRFPAQEHNYDFFLELSPPQSLATAWQIQEYVKAYCQLSGKLPREENEQWQHRIRYLKQWVYTLPLSALEQYLQDSLKTGYFTDIQSSPLSDLQAFYLTGGGDFNLRSSIGVKVHSVFLRAFPASELFNNAVGDIISSVIRHLAANLPANNLPRTLAFINRTRVISNLFTFEGLLENGDINTYMSLISPKDLKAAAPQMLKWLRNRDAFSSVIRQLPQQVLAVLLEEARKNKDWSWQNLLDKSDISHLFVGGLNCLHIDQMELGLFIPVMAQYKKYRTQAFPRNLQICSLQKLISYLKFKMTITQTDPKLGLISILEPIEIESVGGYVLVGLPVDALRVSPYLGHILSTIGNLSNAELILAANMTHLQSIAQLAVEKATGNADAYVTRNLVWFLPPNSTIMHFKMMLQYGLLDKTLCLPQELRRSLALKLITDFGPPDMWSAGVLATLQDLLIVFTDDELRSVNVSAWTDAADMLFTHYGDYVSWIKPTPFHQICASFLEESEEVPYKSAVRRLVRWRLQAAQWLLDTVKPSTHSTGSKKFEEKSTIKPFDYDEDETEKPSVFNPSLNDETTQETTESTVPTTSSTDDETTISSTVTDTPSTTTITTSTDKEVSPTGSNQEKKHSSSLDLNKSTTLKIITNEEASSQALDTTQTNMKGNTSSQNTSQADNDIEKEHSNNFDSQNDVNSLNETERTKEQSTGIKAITTAIPTPPTNSPLTSTTTKLQNNMTVNTTNNHTSNPISHVNENKTDSSFNKTNEFTDSNVKNISELSDVVNHENKTKPSTQKMSLNTSSDDHSSYGYHIEEDSAEGETDSILVPISTSSKNIERHRRTIDTLDSIIQVTCNAVRMVGPLSGLALTENDLGSMLNSEVEECRVEFGKMDLSLNIRKDLWKRLGDKKFVGIHLLGGLLQATTVGDLWDVKSWKVSDPWVVETVHALITNVNGSLVLKKILQEVLKKNSELPPELLTVLGGSLCLLDEDKLNTLEFPIGLQSSETCAPCLPFLAQKAIKTLGPVSEWTPHYVHSLNSIVAGLEVEEWKVLTESPLQPLSALQPSTITCLNISHLEILTPDNMKLIPTLTLHALLPHQIAALTPTQIDALRNATQVSIQDKLVPDKAVSEEGVPSAGSYSFSAPVFIVFVNMIYFVSKIV